VARTLERDVASAAVGAAFGPYPAPLQLYLGLGLVSAAVLLLELTLTRVFSVSLWYHFAFMVVSIALLGVGASGSFVTIARDRLRADLHRALFRAGLLFALATLGTLAIAVAVPFDPSRLGIEPFPQGLYLLLFYLGLALPFFFAGSLVALLLSTLTAQAGQLYGADLAGAGVGCVLFLAALPALGAQGAIVLAALLAVVAALLLGPPRVPRWLLPPAVALAVLAPLAQGLIDVHIPPSKGLALAEQAGARPVLTRWNTFSRVDVTQNDPTRFFAGLSPRYLGALPDQVAIRIDADARTDITRLDGNIAALDYLDHLASALPYQELSQPSVLVIGAGGGTDVVAALHHGAPDVTAVEINPLIVDIVNRDYGLFSGGLYRDPRVHVVVDEGRNYVARSHDRYDLIQISLVDTWAATSSGAYSLSENYLYTREAFGHYYDHLTNRGVLAISRWSREPPVELLRLLSTALAGLEDRGVANPARHLAVVRADNLATTIITRAPLSPDQLAAVNRFAADNGFEVLYPTSGQSNEVQAFIDAPDRGQLIQDYPFNIAPTSDDEPFFFQYGRWRDLNPGVFLDRFGDHNFAGQVILVAALAQALLLGALLILLPLASRRGLRARLRQVRFAPVVLYFVALGLAFMFLEISLMQRLSLFLGHPVYSISTVLFTLLLASGVGSLLTARVSPSGLSRALALAMVTLAALIGLELLLLPLLIQHWLGEPIEMRILASIAAIAPLGLFMGMPFPLGLRLLERSGGELIPWAWAINGCASVVGPVLAVIVAISGGFTLVTALAAALYLLGLGAALLLHPRPASAAGR